MKTSVREVFAVAAAAYDRGNPLLALERPETEAMLPALAGRSVLDVGSGTGHYARLAAALGARLAIAFDLTPEMLGKAPRPAAVGDAGRLPFAGESLDVAIAALLLSFVKDLEASVREIARVLRPGGTFVLADVSAGRWMAALAGERPYWRAAERDRAFTAAGLRVLRHRGLRGRFVLVTVAAREA